MTHNKAKRRFHKTPVFKKQKLNWTREKKKKNNKQEIWCIHAFNETLKVIVNGKSKNKHVEIEEEGKILKLMKCGTRLDYCIFH